MSLWAAIGTLVDRAVLELRETDLGRSRYRMLGTMQRVGQQELEESDRLTVAELAHLGHYVDVAEAADEAIAGPEPREWLEKLSHELPNIRAALSRAMAHGEWDKGLRLAYAMWRYWQARGGLAEGIQHLEDMVEAATAADATDANLPAVAAALRAAGNLAYVQGDDPKAERLYTDSLELQRACDDPRGLASAVHNYGVVMSSLGRHAEAKAHLAEGLELHRALDDQSRMASSLSALGLAALNCRDFVVARESLLEAVSSHRALGNRAAETKAKTLLAETLANVGATDQALSLLRECVLAHVDAGDVVGEAQALLLRAYVNRLKGRYRHALADLDRSESLAEDAEALLVTADVHVERGRLAFDRGDFDEAVGPATEARMLQNRLGQPEAPSWLLLGEVARARGQLSYSVRYLELARDEYVRLSDPLEEANALRELALTRLTASEVALAREDLRRSIALHRSIGRTRYWFPLLEAVRCFCACASPPREDLCATFLATAEALRREMGLVAAKGEHPMMGMLLGATYGDRDRTPASEATAGMSPLMAGDALSVALEFLEEGDVSLDDEDGPPRHPDFVA